MDEAELSKKNEAQVLAYLLEVDAPNWIDLQNNPMFEPRWVAYFLERKKFVPVESVQLIYRTKSLLNHYGVHKALVRCKSTPVGIAANVIPLLRWVDLLNILREPYISGGLKQKIEKQIMDRFPRMALGEKTMLAKQAPRGLIRQLRLSPDRRVIRALFNNYFFTFDDASFLANYPKIPPDILVELAKNPKWTQHKKMRMDLLANPKLPAGSITPLLRGLTAFDARQLLAKGTLPPAVRARLKPIASAQPK